MRAGGVHIFLHYIPALCALGLPLAYALARGAAGRFGLSPGRLVTAGLLAAIPTGFVFALGFAKGFLVLGRHLTPLLPFVLIALGYAFTVLWAGRRVLDRAVVCVTVLALAASALECRFAYRHQKDDNRGAVAVAKAALEKGEGVWWVADEGSAGYYRLPKSLTPEAGAALVLWKPKPAELALLAPPGLIVLSKPDLFDANSGARDFIKEQGYSLVKTLPAFSFWEK
jgi:hypothetical protein